MTRACASPPKSVYGAAIRRTKVKKAGRAAPIKGACIVVPVCTNIVVNKVKRNAD